jgi:hypothetical protein
MPLPTPGSTCSSLGISPYRAPPLDAGHLDPGFALLLRRVVEAQPVQDLLVLVLVLLVVLVLVLLVVVVLLLLLWGA